MGATSTIGMTPTFTCWLPPEASPESSPDDPHPAATTSMAVTSSKPRIRRMLGSLSDVPTSVPGGIPGRTYVEAETPSTAKPDDRSMWPNGDNFELGAYRARCLAVTG